MTAHPYNEDGLVEQPAIALFGELGWRTVAAGNETFGVNGTLGRSGRQEVVLTACLVGVVRKLNPDLPDEAVAAAVDELTRDRSAMSPAAANREVHALLKHGVTVAVTDAERGGQRTERVRVIDWEDPEANDFLLVSQMSIQGALYLRRPDLIGFVNGLPLVLVELKKPGVPAEQAFTDNLTCYKADVPQLFPANALMIASNGTESRVGSLTADWGRYFEWKRIEREDEERRVSLEVMIRGTCEKRRLLDLVENFTLFSEHKAGLVKVVGQNHQFLGVNNAISASLRAQAEGHGRGGVFWQTQGSGKSFSMVFYSQKILRKVPGNWTFVVVTDRVELDGQIAKTFKACGAVSEAEGDQCHATSAAHLRALLRADHRYVFTLIHKFTTGERLTDRRDVIVLTDEAHRSQYDTLAMNMRAALPNATFVAFTGTPLIAGDERTREVFGDYVSIYDFQQSVEDGATVPLFYENRTPELHLENPDLDDDVHALIEEAELDPEAESRLERELGKQYHLITRDDRLETVAKDVVSHFLGRGFQGKAMVVAIDKATALKLHDKVRKHWAAEDKRVEREIGRLNAIRDNRTDEQLTLLSELRARLEVLRTTDMAVIVSAEQNEVAKMAAKGLDIVPHRKRMNDEELDEKFKDASDPLRVVFVCAMWLTGFDAPSCSTVYLDKPMRNHTLMQTIARANRVHPGKRSGLIVDYANVFASLEKALAIYGKGTGGETPVQDKAKLVEELRMAIDGARQFCLAKGVSLAAIEAAAGMDRLNLLKTAVDAVISPDDVRQAFLAHEKLVQALNQAVKPDPAATEFAQVCALLATLAMAVRRSSGGGGQADLTRLMERLNDLLDESIAAEGFTLAEGEAGARHGVIDLSRINFAALAEKFKKSTQKNLDLERLKAAVSATLERLLSANPTRTDYRQKFEELISSYNAGSRNLDQLFEALLKLGRELTEEETRHVREHLDEPELVIFDILTRPAPELSAEEREQVKRVARELFDRIQSLRLTLWRGTQQGRSKMENLIKDALDEGLPPVYDKPLFETKVEAIFQHAYETAA